MKSRPILFSTPMVWALLDGTKTQTRRVWKMPKGCSWYVSGSMFGEMSGDFCDDNGKGWWSVDELACPFGQVGDQLWVRETFLIENDYQAKESVVYRADGMVSVCSMGDAKIPWKPSIFMPRWASRITLEITSVRVERLQDISEADALAEGVTPLSEPGAVFAPAKSAYCDLWESINKPGSWFSNPWVWVIEFKRIGAAACP